MKYSKNDIIEMAEEILDSEPYDLAEAVEEYASIVGLPRKVAEDLYDAVYRLRK